MYRIDVGLSNNGEAMTMIPTYVTKVPNGTEEVRSPTAEPNLRISVPIISISNILPGI